MNNNVGLKIKTLREQAGLKQNQVAAYLNIDQSYLSKIEKGERIITVEMLERLADLYGCDLEMFDSENISVHPVQFALRAKEITLEDMNIIAEVNHIAANSRYMAKLLGGLE